MNVPYKYCTYNHNWAVDSWKEKWTILILLKKSIKESDYIKMKS